MLYQLSYLGAAKRVALRLVGGDIEGAGRAVQPAKLFAGGKIRRGSRRL
jgi:hypothetical protein